MNFEKNYDITVRDVHVPSSLENLSIRGWGSRKKKKKKYEELAKSINIGYTLIQEIVKKFKES